MSYIPRFSLSLCVILPSAFVLGASEDKRNPIARETCERFVKLGLARDLDGVMKMIAVPWCHDAVEMIEEKDEVRKRFAAAFLEKKPEQIVRFHVRKVGTLKELRDQGMGPPSRKVSLGEVLRPDDRIVYGELENADGAFQQLWIGIRFEKSSPMVVGAVD